MTGPSIVTLDIETAPGDAEVWGLFDETIPLARLREPSRVIAFAAKQYGRPRVEFRSEFHDGHAQMVERAWHVVNEADVIVHYNGTRFDLPHLRREFYLSDLGPPSPVLEIDLLRVVRSRFKFMSNKLDHVAQQSGLPGKVETDYSLWARCLRDQDPLAWAQMRKYNINDVKITEQLYEKLRPWLTPTVHQGTFISDGAMHCPRCGSAHVQQRGLSRTTTGVYQRYQCQGCGSWSRDKKATEIVNLRGVQ